MEDKIRLNGISVYAHHGLCDAEKYLGQRFDIDVEIVTDLSPAWSDDIDDALDYRQVYDTVVHEVSNSRFNLIEKLALHLLKKILESTPRALIVTLKVRKPCVPLGGLIDSTEVIITRKRDEMGSLK